MNLNGLGTKNTRGGWALYCGLYTGERRRGIKRAERHGARQAAKRETARSLADD